MPPLIFNASSITACSFFQQVCLLSVHSSKCSRQYATWKQNLKKSFITRNENKTYAKRKWENNPPLFFKWQSNRYFLSVMFRTTKSVHIFLITLYQIKNKVKIETLKVLSTVKGVEKTKKYVSVLFEPFSVLHWIWLFFSLSLNQNNFFFFFAYACLLLNISCQPSSTSTCSIVLIVLCLTTIFIVSLFRTGLKFL